MNKFSLSTALCVVTLSLAVAGCGKASDKKPAVTPPAVKTQPKPAVPRPNADKAPEKQLDKAASDHGTNHGIGKLAIGGYELELTQLGDLGAGKESAVSAKVTKAPAGADWKKANLYMWVEGQGGKRLSPPSKAVVEDGALHLHASVAANSVAPQKLVFRLRANGKDLRASVRPHGVKAAPAVKHVHGPGGHTHAKTRHGGIVGRIGGKNAPIDGYVELKLHGDKGDLELWLSKDEEGKEPLDVAMNTQLSVKFIDKGNRTVALAVRDKTTNKDESGQANVRGAKTNYFIFPSKGEASAWLQGKAFSSIVIVRVTTAGKATNSAELMLQPHSHDDHGGHDHGGHDHPHADHGEHDHGGHDHGGHDHPHADHGGHDHGAEGHPH
ncbi:MAG: hypothetical protein KC502_12690 [Myxococcales bacterium]|nr:hypothetical protein [Myxococcales bacterium]